MSATDQAAEVEKLRELSEAATPGDWFQGYGSDDELWNGDSESSHKIWPDHLGVGRLIARTGTNFTGWMPQDDANAAFIVACVNYVRAALATQTATGRTMGGEGPSKEWCLNMARLEEGQEVGAGALDHPLRLKCELPPAGWFCTREPGHEGPCAALQNGGE